MATRAPSSANSEAADIRPGAGPVAWLGLLCGLAALGLSVSSMLRGGHSGGTAAGASGDLDERLAEHARTLRSELRDDFKHQVAAAEDSLARAARRLDESEVTLGKLVEDGKRVAEDAKRTSADNADVVDGKLREFTDTTGKLRGTVDALSVTVKALESRPVAIVAAPVPKAPTVEPTPPPPGSPKAPDPAAAGPTPEQIAAKKEKVKGWIADLASPDIAKAFTACTSLGAAGDLSAVEPLVKVLHDHKDPMMKTVSATSLGALHACDGVAGLIQAFLDRADEVVLAAGVAFGKIVGQDSGLTGSPTRRERTDAHDKWTKWWTEHETEIRVKWNQPKASPPAPGAPEGPK
jgi:hypothetical protein